ncbi:hypothetical protein G9P44_000774 [Scheffersomyces stipitis]|nr:hypothetical protein G9P44_000774 [Scheffersomyces stipitis]
MKSGIFYLTIGSLLSVAAGTAAPYEKYGAPKKAMYACNYQLSSTATWCSADIDQTTCYCSNPYALSSVAGCYSYAGRNTTKNYKVLIEACSEVNVTLTMDQLEQAYVNYTKNAKSPADIEGFNATEVVEVPIKLQDNVTDLYMRAYDVFLDNYDFSLYYGSGLLGYWCLVFVLAAICNWSKILFPGLFKSLTGPFSTLVRKHITMPATFNNRKTHEFTFLKFFQILIPSRLETLIISGFVILTIALSATRIYYIEGDPLFESRKIAISRYIADRTGILATNLTPLLILFAGRNNFLQWVTRWNFATFITYHKWVARITFILVLIHAVGFTVDLGSYYSEDVKDLYLIMGIVATVGGGIILFQGLLYLRRSWYEFFLLTHIVLAVLWIAGGWLHVVDLGYIHWFYAAAAVWVFDRAVRIGRLIVFGFPRSTVSLLADETLKVDIPKPAHWKSVPGGHAFIHFLRPSCFWQSHPFTFTESYEQKDTITLYCKVKGGVTHGLYQYLATHPGKTTQIRVAVEGPYGEPTAAYRYDSAIFIAGGNGIPGIFSEAVSIASRSRENTKQTIKLFWIVREYKSLLWFYDELRQLKNSKIQTTIFITKPDSQRHLDDFKQKDFENYNSDKIYKESEEKKDHTSVKVESNSENEDEASSTTDIINTIHEELDHINFKMGRPTMEELVGEEIKESTGSVAFVACGHPIMLDDLRSSVVKNLDNKEKKRIEFFEQLQVWA